MVPHPVACFTGANNLEEKLGDFAGEVNSGTDVYNVVEKWLSWLMANITRCSRWGRIVCAYLEQTLKTDTTNGVRMGRSVKTASARAQTVCLFIP